MSLAFPFFNPGCPAGRRPAGRGCCAVSGPRAGGSTMTPRTGRASGRLFDDFAHGVACFPCALFGGQQGMRPGARFEAGGHGRRALYGVGSLREFAVRCFCSALFGGRQDARSGAAFEAASTDGRHCTAGLIEGNRAAWSGLRRASRRRRRSNERKVQIFLRGRGFRKVFRAEGARLLAKGSSRSR